MKNILKKRKIRYLITIMRGYRFLKKNKSLELIHTLSNDLSNIEINILSKKNDKLLFLNKEIAGKIVRQFISNSFLHVKFKQDILFYFGKKSPKIFRGGYPIEWLNYLSNKGIKVDFFKSNLIWKFNISKNLFKSLIYFIKIIFNTICRKNIRNFKNSIYLDSNSITNKLIKQSIIGFTFINWIKEYINKFHISEHKIIINKDFKNVSIEELKKQNIFLDEYFISLKKLKLLPPLINWFLKVFFICLFDLFFSNGLRSNLIQEFMKTKIYDLNSNNNNNFNYAFFSFSDWVYRPLWTYLAEFKGTDVILYFYSTSIFDFYCEDNEEFSAIVRYGWDKNTWNKFFVWNYFQSEFIKSLKNKSKVEIIEPITLDNYLNYELNINSKILADNKSISLFDVTIFRDFLHQTDGRRLEYLVPEIAIKFMEDIIEVCKKDNIFILYKAKRNKVKGMHPKYKKFIDNISYKNFFKINPDISLKYLINISKGCISFPFTSPSVIAKHYKVPSCFYDPTGILKSSELQTHNIDFIKDKEKLGSWIKDI